MSSKPGYFKPAAGSTFRMPRDYCMCRTDDGKIIKKSRSIVPVYNNSPDIEFTITKAGKRRRIRKGALIGVFVGKCDCPEVHRRRKRKPKGRRAYTTTFSRYREKNTNLEKFGGLPSLSILGQLREYSNNQVVSSKSLKGSADGSIDYMRCWDQLNPGPPYRSGGPFALIKGSIPTAKRYNIKVRTPSISGNFSEYEGMLLSDGGWGGDSISNYLATGVPQITGYDSLAWDKLKPQVSKSNLAQFIYELRDLPRQLKTTADDLLSLWRQLGGHSDLSVVMNPKRIADSFLNHQFGWAPFIGDLSSMYNTWQRSHELISEITRDNGSWKKKKARLASDQRTSLISRTYSPGVIPGGEFFNTMCDTLTVDGIACKGFFDLHEVVETDVWAEGDFKYYRPEFDMNLDYGNSYLGAVQRLMTLYGLRINPTLIYKLTPWTWCVDWFSQFGKFIQRVDDFVVDGIVSRGLYIMSHTTRKVRKTSYVFFKSGQRIYTWERSLEMKIRKVADCPYGFDQTWNGLSLRQAAILGAIGITRSDSGFISRGA